MSASAFQHTAIPLHGFAAQFDFWAREVAVPTLRRLCLLLERDGVETGYDHLRGKSVRFYIRYDAGTGRALASLVFTPEEAAARIAVRCDLGEAVHLQTAADLDADALGEMAAALIARATMPG